jgi:hypothetical protein
MSTHVNFRFFFIIIPIFIKIQKNLFIFKDNFPPACYFLCRHKKNEPLPGAHFFIKSTLKIILDIL